MLYLPLSNEYFAINQLGFELYKHIQKLMRQYMRDCDALWMDYVNSRKDVQS